MAHASPNGGPSAHDGHPSFLALLRGWFPNLTDSERRVAEYILANPDRMLISSISEVAIRGGVGASTLTRLATKLGYADYPEMRTALAVELLNSNESALETLADEDDADAVARKVMRLGMQNLQDSLALLDPAEIERAVVAILGARRVEFYANGAATAAMARLAEHRFLVVGVSCAVYDRSAQIIMASGLLGPGDVAIGFSHTGEGPDVVPALRTARELGATTICMTNVPNSSITRVADIQLLTAAWSARPADDHPAASMVAMVAAIDTLYARALLVKHATLTPALPPEPVGRAGPPRD
jgi:RpiR family carbohydrate utilization transcriptional regulator